jgi:1-acyl-sn-glycerol-3-phosphate acyltransferase
MRRLRSLLMVFWTYLWMVLIGLIFLPTYVFGPKAVCSAIRAWAQACRIGLRVIMNTPTELRGYAHLPPGRYLVASKHMCAYDTLVPFITFDAPAIVLKQELLSMPVFGQYAKAANMLSIDRTGALKTLKIMLRAAKAEVARGRDIVIMPEGTRMAPGAAPDYKPGVAALYRELGLPCVPIAHNAGLVWPAHGMTRTPGKIVFEALEPIPPGLSRDLFMKTLEERLERATHALIEEGRAAQAKS